MSLKQSEIEELSNIFDMDDDGETFFVDADGIEDEIKACEKRIEENKKTIELLAKAKDIAKKIDLEYGDAVYVKGMGDALVESISVNFKAYTKSNIYVRTLDEDGISKEYRELLPPSKTNKILYGDSKNERD